jgi:phytoene dehydrogenase-like protein
VTRNRKTDVDVAVIGGGHNGLVCAAYLARAGRSVAVYERRDILGGAAVTEEFAPGFRNSTASYTVSLLHPQIIRELRLSEHGLTLLPRPLQNFLPLPDGRALRAGPTLAATANAVSAFSARDATRLPAWQAMLEAAADFVRALALETPPTELRRAGDLWSLLQSARRFRALSAESQRSLHELFTRSAGDLLDGWFECDALKALYAFDAIVGNYVSPYAAGNGYVMLHHALGELDGRRGAWGHARGGMGAISDAIAAEARRLGVRLETGCAVERVVCERGRAIGLALADGRSIRARAVAANVNPKLLYLRMLEPGQLPAEIRSRMERYRCVSATFRINVALSELPQFPGHPAGDHLRSGIILAPSLGYMERAYFDARTEGWSRAPVVELVIPSTIDDSLCPPGTHVASVFCQHFAPELPGRSWPEARAAAVQTIFRTISEYAPNFERALIAHSALSPYDLQERFGLVGGDIFHGTLGLDQLWAARPLLGFGDYRTPVRGLYLCGAGAHPGGGVSGLPGRNAARRITADWKSVEIA